MSKLLAMFAVIAVFAVAPAAADPQPKYDWSDITGETTPVDLDVGEEMC